ncbi:hypothetical protein BDP27DRAFT_1431786 [Rhodocollybia butyracea]|uniref:DUF6729 domain-containing protein n=1 Tax=Rhodocollybia butyracea TaxID=206335 RepID=A0A9P5TX63_9AGAR|nr:hypothetical protein BDP27DRAFT_1431786 [Rhodocollybia butyracea]
MSFSPDPLCLQPIFVWLPEYLPGRPDYYKCKCGGHLTGNGYAHNPMAQRVCTTTGIDYYLFTNHFVCDLRRMNSPGCGANYQGSDPHILTQLPRWVQEAFPAYLTTQAAVDKLVIDQMKPCFAGRFGPDPFSKMLRELQMLQHSRRELMYLSAAASYGLARPDQVPSFPAFDDPMKYAGINEWEEIRAQLMTLTKGFSVLPEMFKQFSNGLKEHGHPPTSLYFCDNPPAERDFHERVTESLKDRVQHVAVNPFHCFASFEIMFTETVEFYSDPVLINNSCEAILKLLDALPPSETLIVALATYSDPGSHELLIPWDPLSSSFLGIPVPSPSFPNTSKTTLLIGPSPDLTSIQNLSDEEDSTDTQSEDGSNDDQDPTRFDEDSADENLEDLSANSIQDARSLLIQGDGLDSSTFPSRVFDDAFHFMDRLLRTLPKKHSAFKEFSHQFSETIFICDVQDTKAVKAVLEEKGMSWNFVIHSRKPWINCHIRRYVPEPSKLEADLGKLFNSFKNVVCSTDRKKGRGRFFSKESIKVSESLLETVNRGFLSDLPGIPLHYIIGWDCDNLPLYCTIRGTNSIEGGVHMLIHCIFGSLRASPELAMSLLSNWILLGRALQLYWQEMETFFITPLPPKLAADYNISTLPEHRIEGVPHHRDIPAHLLTCLSTKTTNPYRYLQLSQRTIYPVLPVHTRAEYAEFRCLIQLNVIQNSHSNVPLNQAWKGVDFIKFAKFWNNLVDAQDPSTTDSNLRLYYKLLEQLLRHQKKLLEWQASRVTMAIGSNEAMVKEHMNILKDPERLASVLPAVPLEDNTLDPTARGIQGLDLTSFNPMVLVQQDAKGRNHFDGSFEITESREPATEENPASAQSKPPGEVLAIAQMEELPTEAPMLTGPAQYQMMLSFAAVSSAVGEPSEPPNKKQENKGMCCL